MRNKFCYAVQDKLEREDLKTSAEQYNLISQTKPGNVNVLFRVILFVSNNKFGYPVCFNVVVLFPACVSWNTIQDTTCTENGDWQDIPLRWPQRHPYHSPHHAGQGEISFILLQCISVVAEEVAYLSLNLFNRNILCWKSRTVIVSLPLVKGLHPSQKLFDYKSSLKENYSWTRTWLKQVFLGFC